MTDINAVFDVFDLWSISMYFRWMKNNSNFS